MTGGLLGRILEPEQTSHLGGTSRLGSIAAHLRLLLNARQGDAATVPTFGMVDFSGLVHSPQSPQALAASMRATILAHEPRLKNVTVRSVESSEPLLLRFEIAGWLADGNAREVLRFSTEVLPGGHVELT